MKARRTIGGIFVFILGVVAGQLLSDVVHVSFTEYLKGKDIKVKKEVFEQRQKEDLEVWTDSVRMSLDAKYAPKLRPLHEKLQEAEADGLGGSGIVTALRMKINAIKNSCVGQEPCAPDIHYYSPNSPAISMLPLTPQSLE